MRARNELEAFEQVLPQLKRRFAAFGVLSYDGPAFGRDKVILHIELDRQKRARQLSIWERASQRLTAYVILVFLTGAFIVPVFLIMLQTSGIDILGFLLLYPLVLGLVFQAHYWIPLLVFRWMGGYFQFHEYERWAR